MPRESQKARRERTREIVARLKAAYPDSKCSLDFRNEWELLVAVMLSAQCTDERVNMVTPGLFRKWPRPEDLAAAPREAVEDVVRSTGFYRNKAKHIQETARAVVDEHAGKVPDTIEGLTALPGVARKTANVVLHVWYGAPEGSGAGVVVDTHVTRVANRLRLTRSTDAKRIEEDLVKVVEEADWGVFTHLVIDHGRAVCTGRTKPKCDRCIIAALCPSAFAF